jgi:hypothetical protein
MTPTIAEILEEHVTFELEGIDRLYLNGYVPGLQTPEAVAHFLRHQRGATFASSVLLDQISRDYEKRIQTFMRQHQVPLHRFTKGERKDDVTQRHLADFALPEGVLYLGTAQEKFTTVRTEKRVNPATGRTYPWLVRASVLAKVYYWYVVDEDFGPLFIKIGSYFPYPIKVCLNGHEFLKRQLAKKGVAYEALGQRPALLRRPRAGPTHRRRPRRARPRRPLRQVDVAPATPLCPRRPRRRLRLQTLPPPSRVLPHPGL